MSVSRFRKYDLDRKVNDFINQYSREARMTNAGTDIGLFHFPRKLRNFIESEAVFAELRWPYVYGHLDEEKKQIVEKSQQIFTWELFNERVRTNFPRLHLTPKNVGKQVLHRVIERGGNRIGSRRGVLFAQEQDLDVNVPVSYAIDWSDPNLYEFLEPLIPQLDKDTVCPVGYFSRDSNPQTISTITLHKVMSELHTEKLKKQAA